jgi:hypothetical protein
MAGCKCLEKVDAQLAKQGAELDISFAIPEMYCRPVIATQRKDPRSRVKLSRLIASFCPFCGKEYPNRDKARKKTSAVTA